MSSDRKVPEKSLDAFYETLERWVRDAHGDNQSAAARALNFKQTHVSALLGRRKKPGLAVLVALREVSGISLDEWLGFRPPPGSTGAMIERLRTAMQRELDALADEQPSKSSE